MVSSSPIPFGVRHTLFVHRRVNGLKRGEISVVTFLRIFLNPIKFLRDQKSAVVKNAFYLSTVQRYGNLCEVAVADQAPEVRGTGEKVGERYQACDTCAFAVARMKGCTCT